MPFNTGKVDKILGKLIAGGESVLKYKNLFAHLNTDNAHAGARSYSSSGLDFSANSQPVQLFRCFKPLVSSKRWTKAEMDSLLGRGGAVELLAADSRTTDSGLYSFKSEILPIATGYQLNNPPFVHDPTGDIEGYLEHRTKHKTLFEKLDDSKLDRLKVLASLLIWDMYVKSLGAQTEITISNPPRAIPNSAHHGDYLLKKVTILPGVTSIGQNAFTSCKNLEEVYFPPGLTTIDIGAFSQCYTLEDIVLPNSITSIDNWAFGECKRLRSVILPTGISRIARNAFTRCVSLTSIDIPSGVTSIDAGAFSDCAELESIDIPLSVTSVGQDAFKGCKKIKSLSQITGTASVAIKQQILTQCQS